jgi:hypothetical protein
VELMKIVVLMMIHCIVGGNDDFGFDVVIVV